MMPSITYSFTTKRMPSLGKIPKADLHLPACKSRILRLHDCWFPAPLVGRAGRKSSHGRTNGQVENGLEAIPAGCYLYLYNSNPMIFDSLFPFAEATICCIWFLSAL